jgi:hypothetical protein
MTAKTFKEVKEVCGNAVWMAGFLGVYFGTMAMIAVLSPIWAPIKFVRDVRRALS